MHMLHLFLYFAIIKSMSTEKAIKWGTYFLLGWIVVVNGVAWIISFEIDPFGFSSGKFLYGGLVALTIIAIIFWYITTRIIGEIFDIKYYKLFGNPFSSNGYWMDIWKNSSPRGKFIQILFIPEILFIAYLVFTNDELLSRIWIILLIHFSLFYKVCGKQIRESYIKHYGKEMGGVMYKATYSSIQRAPSSLGARLFNLKFILFILIINPLELMITIWLLNIFLQNGQTSLWMITFWGVILLVAIQDLIIFDKITRKTNST